MSNPNDKKPTQMTAPAAETKMVQPEKKSSEAQDVQAAPEEKKVKIKALMEIETSAGRLQVGQEASVPEAEANMFAKQIEGHYSFSGERGNGDAERHKVQRAQIVG